MERSVKKKTKKASPDEPLRGRAAMREVRKEGERINFERSYDWCDEGPEDQILWDTYDLGNVGSR